MPSTCVYLLSPRLIAAIAASLMLSGVSKSGSPAPSPITSRPAALRARALSVTAMVGDGLMRLSESARKAMRISEKTRGRVPDLGAILLERDDFPSNRHLALSHACSMIFPENRYPLFGIML